MDLMKMGFIDPNKGLEVMEVGGIGKLYEHIQTDIRQAQRENVRMSAATPELIKQFTEEQAMAAVENPDSVQNPLLSPMGEPRMPLIVPVNTWDDHRLHIQIHNKFRKSQAFEQCTPEAKALFEMHVRMHVEQIVVGQMAASPMGIASGMTDPAMIGEQDAMAQQEQGAPPPSGMDSGMPPMPPEGGNSSGFTGNDSASG
jgi:hypothetical protein